MAKQHFSFDDEPSRPRKSSHTSGNHPKTQNIRSEHFEFSDERPSQRKSSGPSPQRPVSNNARRNYNGAANRRPTSTRRKKTKTRGIKRWQLVLLILFALVVAFTGTMIYMAREDGPVYGDRCDGQMTVKRSAIKATISEMKRRDRHLIQDFNITVQCKELKFDIAFKHNATEVQAKEVARRAVRTLDQKVGAPSYKHSKYSALFNKYNGVKQFECDFYMTCPKGNSWPIYGTKMAGHDRFNFSDAKIKNRTSYNKAEKTK